MAKRIIEISVNDEYVVGSGVVIGAEGSDESVILRVSFNDAWLGLNIYATFRNSMGESPTVVMLMPSMLVIGEKSVYEITVPAASTAYAGKMSLVFSGFAVTTVNVFDAGAQEYDKIIYKDAIINTANAYFRVLPSDFSALDVKDPAEVTALEQVLEEINTFYGTLEEHKKATAETVDEISDVVADINDAYERGELKGEKGDTYDLTDEDKAEIADIVEVEIIGDINEALDRIIAIQTELIGKPTITFSIDGVKCTAEEGMTWGEWLESEYNTVGASSYTLDDITYAICGENHFVAHPDSLCWQTMDGRIEENVAYYCSFSIQEV